MTTQTHQPWKPTCWVGGMSSHKSWPDIQWISQGEIQIFFLSDADRRKYAATKATAAILRSMRK